MSEELKLIGAWPTEEMIQQACLDDCTVKYDSYHEWWDSLSSGTSRMIRKLFVGDYIGRQIDWEEYEQWESDYANS